MLLSDLLGYLKIEQNKVSAVSDLPCEHQEYPVLKIRSANHGSEIVRYLRPNYIPLTNSKLVLKRWNETFSV